MVEIWGLTYINILMIISIITHDSEEFSKRNLLLEIISRKKSM